MGLDGAVDIQLDVLGEEVVISHPLLAHRTRRQNSYLDREQPFPIKRRDWETRQ